MRWWGWGHQSRRVPLTPQLAAILEHQLGVNGTVREPVALTDVELPEMTLDPRARQRLETIVGPAWVRTDSVSRVGHAAGKSYLDLVRMRAGTPQGAPDAVVVPASHDEVAAVLATCAQERVAVVPFGGGTSIVGGLGRPRGAPPPGV
jgi:alkyldihydroxyacetonephosphate synthase